jgi:hypothetical protein
MQSGAPVIVAQSQSVAKFLELELKFDQLKDTNVNVVPCETITFKISQRSEID